MSYVGNEIKKLGLMKAYEFLDKDPEANLPRLVDWFDTYVPDGVLSLQCDLFRNIVTEKDTNWYNLLVSLWSDIDDDVRKALFENLIINANALAAPKAKASREKYGCNIPWAIAMGIEDNGQEGNLTFDEWDSVIEQAKELGTFMFIFEGGDPLDSKEEIIALCNKHYDCEFMIFTDGTKITEEFADEMIRVKNLIVTVRVTGTGEDLRLREATEILRRKKVPFSAYCFYNKDNQDRFSNEKFFDVMIENGVKMCLFFSSMDEEDDHVYEKIKEYRKTKPIVTINFCKDKDITGGCVAGGRYFCSIDHAGNVEPCFFIKKSDSNVRSMTLLEALQAPLCMKYHDENVPCEAEM